MTAEAVATVAKIEPIDQSKTDTDPKEISTNNHPEEAIFSPSVSGNKGCSNCPRDYNI